MGELILLNTAFSDVKIAFVDNGSGTVMDYLWVEKNGVPRGVSWRGSQYVQVEKLPKDTFPLQQLAALERIAKSEVMKIFSHIIISDDELNMDEVQSVLTEEEMSKVKMEYKSDKQNYLSLSVLLKEFLTQNKGSLSGVRELIFQAASVKNLFSTEDENEDEKRPEIGLTRNIMAAMITDENSTFVLQQECIQLLKDHKLMAGIFNASMVLDELIQKRDDQAWWVNFVGEILLAVRGKSSVKMYLKGIDQPIEIQNLSKTILGPDSSKYFTPKGLACFYFQLKISKPLLALNALDDGIILPYKKIDRLEYRKKVIWKNPI